MILMLIILGLAVASSYANEPSHLSAAPISITDNTHAISKTTDSSGKQAGHGGHGGGHGEETPPEHFVVLDLIAEALEASIFGLWVKITELKPKIEHIQQLYRQGEKNKALAKALGVSTEVILIGFFIETLGVPETFIMAMSFTDNWWLQLAHSFGGVFVSTKAATIIAEHVEEAVEEKYEHEPFFLFAPSSLPIPPTGAENTAD
ncbi:hypothetical protein TI04_08820 [Achromatium sp. WMS2]|nr:hypothetical protein TI04_08820 [Achromatium sp. WMS2]